MKKQRSFLYYIFIFALAQLGCLSLLGLLIYWYVYNLIILKQAENQIFPQALPQFANIILLISGCVLFVAVAVGMSLIFRNLNIQLKLNKLYDNFISNVTHELKSPLASIRLCLETMDIRDVPADRQKKFISMMIKDAERLDNLISSILEISRLEQKKMIYDYSVYTAESIVRELLNESREQFRLPEEAIIITGEAPCQCVLDRSSFKIVFDNLLDNAIKFTPGTVKISVHLTCSLKKVRVEFRDYGIGVRAGDQTRIFRKFHRVHNPNAPNVKGTGLGLYWTKEIVEYHGGTIEALSEGQNKGVVFIISLPIYQVSKKRHLNRLLKITRREKAVE